jgi:dinuclear metal center YbgI/SA1388 family protein
MATVADLLVALDRIAPFRLAESWDNVGLLLGAPEAACERVLVALEVIPEVIDEARRRDVHAIVAHHPLLFRPLKSLAETTPQTRMLSALQRAGIALIAAHTNWDSVADGTNGEIADRLQLTNRVFLSPAPTQRAFKYAVFVPTTHIAVVIDAVHAAGAGIIGNYSHCTFRISGTGTYKPLQGANPFAGKIDNLEQANEVRLETVCPADKLSALIDAVKSVHPYEEVAFDVYPLENPSPSQFGLGLVGDLPQSTPLRDFAEMCKRAFARDGKQALTTVGMIGEASRPVHRIAICSGGGGSMVQRAIASKADAYLTGEMTHHDAADLMQGGLTGILVGHFASEVIANQRLADRIRQQPGLQDVEVIVSTDEKGPVTRV